MLESTIQYLSVQVASLRDQQSQLEVSNGELESRNKALIQQNDRVSSEKEALNRQLKEPTEGV